MPFKAVLLSVVGTPKGQPRPRATVRGQHAGMYDPGTADGWKHAIAMEAKPFLPIVPIDGPVGVDCVFLFPRPKSHSNKKGLKPDAPLHHTGRPDIDNLQKAVLDALVQCGLLRDDSIVAKGLTWKRYGACAGASIAIYPLATAEEGNGQ